jgi:ABC-type uncharacterized transport system YnjBCD ATPase subunit
MAQPDHPQHVSFARISACLLRLRCAPRTERRAAQIRSFAGAAAPTPGTRAARPPTAARRPPRSLDKSKVLLIKTNGILAPGFTALMGPSGAGKTTLLNALALRLTSATMEGELLLNGKPYDRATLKDMSSYVLQEDLMSAHLTCEETLSYASLLMLPKSWSRAQRAARVDDVLRDMNIERSRHTVVGSALVKGISGGERKRLAVGERRVSRFISLGPRAAPVQPALRAPARSRPRRRRAQGPGS